MAGPARRNGPTVTLLRAGAGKGAEAAREKRPTYRVLVDEGEIGTGGSAVVRKAYDPTLRRTVATKVMLPRLRDNPSVRQRFIDEARIIARLDHPNITPVHDLVVDHDAVYFVMKLVAGRTLESVVTAPGPVAPAQALRDAIGALVKVCDALAFAHNRNVIHCDLKPANIMVGDFGEVYLMDWGIASALSTGEGPPGPRGKVSGTPAFMAPEQASGARDGLSALTDVFGVGAVLYFIVTGRPPFPGRTITAALARAATCDFEDPEAIVRPAPHPDLVRIIRKAMQRRPRDRHQSVIELRGELDAFLRSDWHLPAKVFPRGATIVKEGDFADAAYIVVTGKCEVSRLVDGRRKVVRTLEEGAVFGETGILSGDRRTASVRAVTEVTLKVVTREIFQHHLGLDTWMSKFVRALADRFRDLEKKIGESG